MGERHTGCESAADTAAQPALLGPQALATPHQCALRTAAAGQRWHSHCSPCCALLLRTCGKGCRFTTGRQLAVLFLSIIQ